MLNYGGFHVEATSTVPDEAFGLPRPLDVPLRRFNATRALRRLPFPTTAPSICTRCVSVRENGPPQAKLSSNLVLNSAGFRPGKPQRLGMLLLPERRTREGVHWLGVLLPKALLYLPCPWTNGGASGPSNHGAWVSIYNTPRFWHGVSTLRVGLPCSATQPDRLFFPAQVVKIGEWTCCLNHLCPT
jgi:hypothetical protein